MIQRIGFVMCGVIALVVCPLLAAEPAQPAPPTTGPSPAPLSDQLKNGLGWLVKSQLDNGAWGQGEESSEMGVGMIGIKDTPNVADTCMAVMALLRAGNAPTSGTYCNNVSKAVDFVIGQIEASDDQSLSVTTLNGTRTQMKLGSYIDTFMAAQALAELKGKMGSPPANQRLDKALAKVLHKMDVNQKGNGQWADNGWAPTIAQAEASKAANIAVQQGASFDEDKLASAEGFAREDFKEGQNVLGSGGAVAGAGGFGGGGTVVTGRFGPAVGAGNAGVPLYTYASDIAAMQASANSNRMHRSDLQAVAKDPTTSPADREAAIKRIKDMDGNDADLANAQDQVVKQLQDPRFAAGFGSNGGEEYLSYLNIGESLYQKGGAEWINWVKGMTDNLDRIQNDDGSWSGGHCITGRTFCTAAALQVLCIDRADANGTPRPVEATPLRSADSN
jgi:hypothetical protein